MSRFCSRKPSARSNRCVTNSDLDAPVEQRPHHLPRDLRPSRSLVDANDSLHSSMQCRSRGPRSRSYGRAPRRASRSPSSRPPRACKWVNTPSQTFTRRRLRRDEHPALGHQLRQPDAAQERRLPALVGARDHHQRLAVGVDIVADDALPRSSARGTRRRAPGAESASSSRATGAGNAVGSPCSASRSREVQAGDVEAELGPQHRRRSCARGRPTAASALATRLTPLSSSVPSALKPPLVAIRDREAVAGAIEHPPQAGPAPVADAACTRCPCCRPSSCALISTAPVELERLAAGARPARSTASSSSSASIAKNRVNPGERELRAVLVGHRAQAPEEVDEQLHLLHRAREHRARRVAAAGPPRRSSRPERLAGQGVELPHDRRLLEAIGERPAAGRRSPRDRQAEQQRPA